MGNAYWAESTRRKKGTHKRPIAQIERTCFLFLSNSRYCLLDPQGLTRKQGGFVRNMPRLTAGLISAIYLAQSLAHAGLPFPPDMHSEPLEREIDAYPIVESINYHRNISTVPAVNPQPNPAAVGDEITEVSYLASNGLLYNVQINLTKKTIKIIRNNLLIRQASLTNSDVQNIRDTSDYTEKVGLIDAIVVAIVGAIVGAAITIAYQEYADRRACHRGVLAGNSRIVREIMECKSRGMSFDISDSHHLDCGASAHATCVL